MRRDRSNQLAQHLAVQTAYSNGGFASATSKSARHILRADSSRVCSNRTARGTPVLSGYVLTVTSRSSRWDTEKTRHENVKTRGGGY
jgi:hypothetical protein